VLDLTPVLRPTTDATIRDWVREYDVREPTPDIREETTMDETQLHALYRMITKELCIVQGPPGTGKTFTSVEALKVLLANQGKGDPPIIIAAQTNHALDQLLHLCLNAGARIVRVGGRTESERIAEHTMYEVRKRLGSGPDGTWRVLDSDRRKYNQEITGLANTVFNDVLLEPADLLATGVLTQAQYTSLVDEDTQQTASHHPHGPFSLWLSGEVIQTDILRNKYSEQDLAGDDEEYNKDEYEFEGEFEHIAADDDDEDRIQGHFVPLVYTWAGKQPTNQTWQRRAERELRRSDLFQVPKNMRGAVYQVLYERYIEKLRPLFIDHFTQYNTICKELKVNKWHQDAVMVDTLRLNIVGCTTTGLTKYRGFLAALGAKTMLIEEAAETRESNIVSALYPSIQQLILVGDHQQLTPFSNVRWLSQAPYYLDLSMFERMVDYLGIPYIMLDKQRRMAPEIRAVVDTFYDGLEDHPVALQREAVPGMGDRRTWLFNHSWEDATDANHSRFNTEEAIMIVNFFAYLVNNGTKPEKITVLTYYMAQRRLILKKLRQHPSLVAESYHVHTVDSYQGEENDVVLLSLVRSPPPHADYAVGFLESKNRAIVAISRARRGFYMFGNIVNAINATKQSSEIWSPILNTFIQQKRFDQLGLPLECQPHGKLIWIKNTAAWGDNAGGCDQRCTFVRTCGHQCTLTCHVKSHEQIRCSQVCGKMLACGHKCQIWCKDPCNCVCEEFQSVKQAVRTRQVQDEARLHMDLEDILRQEAEARPTVQTRLIQGETLVPVDLDEFQGNQPLVNGLPVASKSREVVRLGPGQLRMTAPPNGKTGGRATSNMKSPASMNPPPGQRPLPPMVPPGLKPLPGPRTQGHLPPMMATRGSGATNGAGNSYQHFVQNVVAHDTAHVEAQRAALAKSSGAQPDIRETYRPVVLVDGHRVDTPPDGNSPQKVHKAITTDHAELPADLNSWMEGLTVGLPPESVATRPSSADASEFRRSVQESDAQNSLID
jgi:helicase required for RNAi-mediated heterochromatin assembly 1